MGITFSENIIIQFFDNQKIYKPKIRKTIAIINDHILTSLPFSNGQKAINPNTIAKTIPKLLFELIFISL